MRADQKNLIRFRALTLAAAVVVVWGGWPGAIQILELPGRPTQGVVELSADPVDAYMVGMWYLALATGRAACHQGEVTPQLRSLTIRDLEWIQRGKQAHAMCGSTSRFAVVQPIDVEAAGAEDLRNRLGEVRADYEHLTDSAECWPARAAPNVRAVAQPIFALGEAAADTLCVIASWNGSLPPERARNVLQHVEAARQAALKIPDAGVRATFLTRLSPLVSQISTQTGEDVYHSLSKIVGEVRNVLKGAR